MYKKTVSVLLLTMLLLTACVSSFPDFPVDDETIVVLDNETTVAVPDDTTVPEQDETTDPEQNTKPPSNESVVTQAKPAQTEVISSPLIVSGPDTEHPDDVDVLNPIPYKAYIYESRHPLPLISDSGFYTWYNKVPYGYRIYELVEEMNVSPKYSITVNGVEYVGIYKETVIQNCFGSFGTLKRRYEISDCDDFMIDANTGELVYINLKPTTDITNRSSSEEEAFRIGVTFIEQQASNASYIDAWNYRYIENVISNTTYYTLYYQRYINDIPVDDRYQVTIDLNSGNIQHFEKSADCSEMESMSGYIDFGLAKLCADEKMREVMRNYFYVTEKEIGEPEVSAIRLSSNGAFCMVYEYPIYNTKSKEFSYLSILVCVLNPDFQH